MSDAGPLILSTTFPDRAGAGAVAGRLADAAYLAWARGHAPEQS